MSGYRSTAWEKTRTGGGRMSMNASRLCSRKPQVSAGILSHAHADHTGLLNLVPANVPIYCSEGTSMMMKAGWTYAGQKDVPRSRKRILKEREPVRIGDFFRYFR
jgi:glyoxylase-like metal-dependent hydrolase (beta-lactamase superfamily II)